METTTVLFDRDGEEGEDEEQIMGGEPATGTNKSHRDRQTVIPFPASSPRIAPRRIRMDYINARFGRRRSVVVGRDVCVCFVFQDSASRSGRGPTRS
jgi:hypothetical protein